MRLVLESPSVSWFAKNPDHLKIGEQAVGATNKVKSN